MSLGSGSGGFWGAVFLWKVGEKERGWGGLGGGVGTGEGTGKSMRKLCRNYPLAIYPLVSPRKNHKKCQKELSPEFRATRLSRRKKGGSSPEAFCLFSCV